MNTTNSTERRSSPAFAIGGDTMRRGDVVYVEMPDFVVLERATAEKCLALVERVLASQGEHAEPLIVKLQHELSEQLNPFPVKS